MNEPIAHEALTPLQKAKFVARRFAALQHRDGSVWSVSFGKPMVCDRSSKIPEVISPKSLRWRKPMSRFGSLFRPYRRVV